MSDALQEHEGFVSTLRGWDIGSVLKACLPEVKHVEMVQLEDNKASPKAAAGCLTQELFHTQNWVQWQKKSPMWNFSHTERKIILNCKIPAHQEMRVAKLSVDILDHSLTLTRLSSINDVSS